MDEHFVARELFWTKQNIANKIKTVKSALTITIFLLGLLFFCGCSKRDLARDIFEQGRQKYDKQDWNGAVADFTHVLQLETNYAVYANRALAEAKLNRLDDALHDYRRAIELEPTNSQLYIESAFLEDKENNLDAAITDYSKAIQFNPKNENAYFNRGIAMRKKRKLNEAVADFSRVIELNTKNADAYNERGWVEFLETNYDAAIADATFSIQLDSTFERAYGTRGWARYGKGDLVGAVEDCKKSVDLCKTNPLEAYFDQGMLDFIHHDYEKAIAVWEKAILLDASSKQELQPWIEKAKAVGKTK